MLRNVTIILLFAMQPALSSEWTYQGQHGPQHWADVSPDFALCGQGVNQSPVDISAAVEADLPTIQMNGSAAIKRGFNNGHTVQFDFATGLETSLGKETFELKQVHFHSPSENRIDGQAFALEAHFVHASPSGELAVMGVMFSAGEENKRLGELLHSVEQGGGESEIEDGSDWQTLLPSDLDYYYFSGSLTTPPCSEGVHWMVLKNTLQVSEDQVAGFSESVHGPNARPVQALNARMILQ